VEVRTDAMIARDRCIDALEGCTDPETRLSLWKAAKRYQERVKFGASTVREENRLAPRAGELGSFVREWG